ASQPMRSRATGPVAKESVRCSHVVAGDDAGPPSKTALVPSRMLSTTFERITGSETIAGMKAAQAVVDAVACLRLTVLTRPGERLLTARVPAAFERSVNTGRLAIVFTLRVAIRQTCERRARGSWGSW